MDFHGLYDEARRSALRTVLDKSNCPAVDEIFGPWMMGVLGGKWFPGRGQIIGLWDSRPLAACLYEGFNGASVMLHIATDGTRRWMNRDFLWYCHAYPFDELRVKKIICPVESNNIDCKRFIEHLGYALEATLTDSAPAGNLLIYTMRKDQCKWLKLSEGYRGGKTKSSATA